MGLLILWAHFIYPEILFLYLGSWFFSLESLIYVAHNRREHEYSIDLQSQLGRWAG